MLGNFKIISASDAAQNCHQFIAKDAPTPWLSCDSTSHCTQNRSFQRCRPSQSLDFVWNLTEQNNQNVLQHKINQKKLKPGFVSYYDIWPGNGEGLFWFWCFINMALTYSPGTTWRTTPWSCCYAIWWHLTNTGQLTVFCANLYSM